MAVNKNGYCIVPFISNSPKCKLIYSRGLSSGCLETGEAKREEFLREMEGSFGECQVMFILIVVMVSWVCVCIGQPLSNCVP